MLLVTLVGWILRKQGSANRQNRDVPQRACRQEFACIRGCVNIAHTANQCIRCVYVMHRIIDSHWYYKRHKLAWYRFSSLQRCASRWHTCNMTRVSDKSILSKDQTINIAKRFCWSIPRKAVNNPIKRVRERERKRERESVRLQSHIIFIIRKDAFFAINVN